MSTDDGYYTTDTVVNNHTAMIEKILNVMHSNIDLGSLRSWGRRASQTSYGCEEEPLCARAGVLRPW